MLHTGLTLLAAARYSIAQAAKKLKKTVRAQYPLRASACQFVKCNKQKRTRMTCEDTPFSAIAARMKPSGFSVLLQGSPCMVISLRITLRVLAFNYVDSTVSNAAHTTFMH